MSSDDEDDRARKPTEGRFARFARLSSLTAAVAARHLGQKVTGAFLDEEDRAEAARAAQKKTAVEITKTLGDMKGAAMKVGQMMATDPELLPPDMMEEIAKLQHSAPPMPMSQVRSVVEAALGGSIEDHFRDFSHTPIGAASIGQVHRGLLHTGEAVAIKVQYPGIADAISGDMKNLGTLLQLARAQLPKERVDGYLDEVTAVIQRESDYLLEAENLERFHVLLKSLPGVRVPAPVHELTRKNVLVMEYFEGEKLEAWLKDAPDEQRGRQGERLLQAYLEMMHRHGVLHADPHPGNFLVLTKEPPVDGIPPIGLLDCGCVREYPLTFTDNLIRLLASLWRHDLDAMRVVWQQLDFSDTGVDPEVVYEWLEIILEPLLQDRVFDFGTWRVQDRAMRFLLENPRIKNWAPPREALFYVRTLAGLRGLIHKSGVRMNVHRLARGIAIERGVVRR